MAKGSGLPLPELEEEDEPEEILTLNSIPYWSHVYGSDSDPIAPDDHQQRASVDDGGDNFESDLSDRIHELAADASESDSTDLFDRENPVNFVVDLFQESMEQTNVTLDCDRSFSERSFHESRSGVIGRSSEFGVDCLDSELGIGLGWGLDLEDDNCDEFIVSDCGDDFFVARRNTKTEILGNLVDGDMLSGGLRVVGMASDSEEDENDLLGIIDLHSEEEDYYAADNMNDDDISIPLCWDSFQLEDNRDAGVDFEWEEVDGRVDEREAMSVMVNPEEEESASISTVTRTEEGGGAEREGHSDWEVLLNVNNLDRNPEMESDAGPSFGEHDDYIYTTDFEMMFGQFGGGENGFMGRLPASKSVIDNLPCVVMTEKEVLYNNALCAVCKDEYRLEELAKELPCSHRYHGDCILPWLEIRNTCPVCRYELPTDDPDYEQRRTQRAT
ncbi:hypothetical protein Nepgr_018937 [Nepenthes gracilis]|uniref:RING-type E3 ubiquitin transferase n=1 Tax=Nepenthes gracilis TaxID=150966 RepID=A0AAD3SUD4_NEPGR|nr:hypothetical protein Nepgr_018937 [Nepenthes gracilis]